MDDSAVAQRLPCTLLEPLGCSEILGTANNGREALRQVEAYQPDLMVMDIKMPEMDGLEATRRLLQTFPSLRIILVSLYDSAEVRKTCQALGAHGFVPKDRLYPELVEQITQLFVDEASRV